MSDNSVTVDEEEISAMLSVHSYLHVLREVSLGLAAFVTGIWVGVNTIKNDWPLLVVAGISLILAILAIGLIIFRRIEIGRLQHSEGAR